MDDKFGIFNNPILKSNKDKSKANGKESLDTANFVFKDISRLHNNLMILLKVSLIFTSLLLISNLFELKLLNDLQIGNYNPQTIESQATSNDLRTSILQTIWIMIFVVTGIMFLRWIYFMNSNSRALGASNMEFTPGWAIAHYFIPFFNLFQPYKAMKEIWQASKDPNNWKILKTPSILPQWWTLWLVNIFLDRMVARSVMKAEELDELMSVSKISILNNLVYIPLCIIAIKLLSDIYEMQNKNN